MTPLLANFPLEAVLGISIPFAAGIIVALTAIITGHLRKMQRDDMEATLKMEMIQRGMSADEIERVLAARIGSQARASRVDARVYASGPVPSAPRREA
ncbi:MAG: hypothetical protein WD063_03975 [Pirellulales bacterium]